MSLEIDTLIILADLSTVRAFRTRISSDDRQHLEELEVEGKPPTRQPLHEQVSDQAGRFPGGAESGEPGGMRHGEGHGRTTEDERRQIGEVASIVEKTVCSQNPKSWRLAAPKMINNRLVAQLSESIRQRLVLNLHAELTKLPIRKVEEQMLHETSAQA